MQGVSSGGVLGHVHSIRDKTLFTLHSHQNFQVTLENLLSPTQKQLKNE